MSNIHFIRSGADYWRGAEAHPLLHTWSLSVEEQFYFVWPLAIAAIALLAARNPRFRATYLLAFITALGFAAAEWARHHLALEGFYFSAFRLWEFSAGALLSAYQRDFRPTPGSASRSRRSVGSPTPSIFGTGPSSASVRPSSPTPPSGTGSASCSHHVWSRSSPTDSWRLRSDTTAGLPRHRAGASSQRLPSHSPWLGWVPPGSSSPPRGRSRPM